MRCPDCNALVTPDLQVCPTCRRTLQPAFTTTGSVLEKYRSQIDETRSRWSRDGPRAVAETSSFDGARADRGRSEETSVTLDVETPGVLNLLLLHGGYSPLSGLAVRGARPGLLSGASLRVTSEPAVFSAKTIPLSGTESWLEPPLVAPDHASFFAFDEAVQGEIEVTLDRGGHTLTKARQPVTVHSADLWISKPGCEAALAGTVTPNAGVVTELIRGLDGDFTGYQSASSTRVGREAAAAEGAVRRLGLDYLGVAPSFEGDSQKVRFPDQTVAAGRASCVDGAVLTAAVLERFGLHPLIVFLRDDERHWGHAICGVWTADIRAKDPILRDRQIVDRAVADGDLLVWDATPGPQRSDFATAVEAGRRVLRHFEFAVDVRASRDHGFKPMPRRTL